MLEAKIRGGWNPSKNVFAPKLFFQLYLMFHLYQKKMFKQLSESLHQLRLQLQLRREKQKRLKIFLFLKELIFMVNKTREKNIFKNHCSGRLNKSSNVIQVHLHQLRH